MHWLNHFLLYKQISLYIITRPGDLKSPGSCCELAPREAVSGLSKAPGEPVRGCRKHLGKHLGNLLGAYRIHLGKHLGNLLGAYKIDLGKLLGNLLVAYKIYLGKALGEASRGL
jgi:hypothetical protein